MEISMNTIKNPALPALSHPRKMLLSCIALAALTACGGGQQDDPATSRLASEEFVASASEQGPAASILEGLAAQYPNGQLPKEKAAQAALELAQSPAVLTYTAMRKSRLPSSSRKSRNGWPMSTRKVLGQKLEPRRSTSPWFAFARPAAISTPSSPAEIDAIASQNPTWVREGTAMYGSSETNWGLSPVYRFRNNVTGSYIYTISRSRETKHRRQPFGDLHAGGAGLVFEPVRRDRVSSRSTDSGTS